MSQNITLTINFERFDYLNIAINNHSQEVLLKLSSTSISAESTHNEACKNENNNDNSQASSQDTLAKGLNKIFSNP